jgi:hypothetical protein
MVSSAATGVDVVATAEVEVPGDGEEEHADARSTSINTAADLRIGPVPGRLSGLHQSIREERDPGLAARSSCASWAPVPERQSWP